MNKIRYIEVRKGEIEKERECRSSVKLFYFDNMYLCNCCSINRHYPLHRFEQTTWSDDTFVFIISYKTYLNAKITYKYLYTMTQQLPAER